MDLRFGWTKSDKNEVASSIYGVYGMEVGLGGLGVTCSSRDPRFAGSNPAEVYGFFQEVKNLGTNPPGGTLYWGSRV